MCVLYNASQIEAAYTIIHSETLQWRHNDRDGVSNHRRLDYLLSRLFRRRSKKHQSSASLAFMRSIYPPGSVDSSHKGTLTRKIVHLMRSSWKFCQNHVYSSAGMYEVIHRCIHSIAQMLITYMPRTDTEETVIRKDLLNAKIWMYFYKIWRVNVIIKRLIDGR